MSIISIIIPIYNVEKYIHRCVDSVINQTYTDLEIILVDDGSPDNCGKICDEYAKKDNRIKVIHKENGGLSDARNHGIESAIGEWLFFLDSDDWIYPQTIENLYAAAIENNVSVSMCAYEETDSKSLVVDDSKKSTLWTPKDLYLKHHVTATTAWGKLYHKDCFKNIRYPAGKIHEDEFVTYRILFAQEKIAFINQPYYAYFMNDEGIMRSKWTPARITAVDSLEEQCKFFRKLKDEELIAFSDKTFLLRFVCCHMNAIENGYPKEAKKLTRKAFFLVLRSPRKMFSPQNLWVLEHFFPRFMRCYWLVKAFSRKIFRKNSD